MPELRLDVSRLEGLLNEADPTHANLFAYPAQSNFSGVKHPHEFVAQERNKRWSVLLDTAAFVPTSRLDLSDVQRRSDLWKAMHSPRERRRFKRARPVSAAA